MDRTGLFSSFPNAMVVRITCSCGDTPGSHFLPSTSIHLWTQLYVQASVRAWLRATRRAGWWQLCVPAAPWCRCWTPARCAGRTCAAPPAARGSGRTAWSHTGTGSRWKRVPWTSQETETKRHSRLLEQKKKLWHIHGYSSLLKEQVLPKPPDGPRAPSSMLSAAEHTQGLLCCYSLSRVRFLWLLSLEVVSGSICSNINICTSFSSKGPRFWELLLPSLSRNWNSNFTGVKFTLTISVQL